MRGQPDCNEKPTVRGEDVGMDLRRMRGDCVGNDEPDGPLEDARQEAW